MADRTRALLTVGLSWGDETKGSVCDYLCRVNKSPTVVRYCGGAQCAHHVVLPDGTEHVFAQFGSGTLAGADTFLSKYMLIDPLSMMREADALTALGVKPWDCTTIDERALLITPYHQAINRLKELSRKEDRHGSCGMGIGECQEYARNFPYMAPRMEDLLDPDRLRSKLQDLHSNLAWHRRSLTLNDDPCVMEERTKFRLDDNLDWIIDSFTQFASKANLVTPAHWEHLKKKPGTLVFEGAQGVLLDETYGFHPHNTWSNTTLDNATDMLRDFTGETVRIGITRAYSTRHGNGPFPTHDRKMSVTIPDQHNQTNAWQGDFRVGPLDLVLLKYALDIVGGVDYLAVTCLDRLKEYRLCGRYTETVPFVKRGDRHSADHLYNYQTDIGTTLGEVTPVITIYPDEETFLDTIEVATGVQIGLESYGPTHKDKLLSDDVDVFESFTGMEFNYN